MYQDLVVAAVLHGRLLSSPSESPFHLSRGAVGRDQDNRQAQEAAVRCIGANDEHA